MKCLVIGSHQPDVRCDEDAVLGGTCCTEHTCQHQDCAAMATNYLENFDGSYTKGFCDAHKPPGSLGDVYVRYTHDPRNDDEGSEP